LHPFGIIGGISRTDLGLFGGGDKRIRSGAVATVATGLPLTNIVTG